MENLDLLEPEHIYANELKDKHHENVSNFFDELTKKSGIDAEANRLTCSKYYKEKKTLDLLNKKMKKLKGLKVLFIILCFIIVGIFLLIFVYKPKKKELDSLIQNQETVVNKLLQEAYAQLAPLNGLFDSSMPAKLMQKTCPLIEMDRIFDVKKYELMSEKYGFWDNSEEESSTLDIQSGSILGNPFVVFKDLRRDIVQQVYEGHLTITYYTGSGDNRHMVTQTLSATVSKPKPVYSKETYLVYCTEAGEKVSFSRTPSKINSMDEKEIEKYVRKNEKDLVKLAEKQTKKGGTYTPLGNSEFELFFGGLDRDDEITYRLLFTPLAQKSMLQLLKSKIGFGDDFSFTKVKGVNIIQSNHSQGEALFTDVSNFVGFDYELVKDNFVKYNDNFFKCLFFDFAPLLCIPLYSSYKSHEYIYKKSTASNINCFEHELLANRANLSKFIHPDSDTEAILKTSFVSKSKDSDIVNVTAHSYKIEHRIEYVSKLGGDGRWHEVPVHYDEYIPLEREETMVATDLGINNEIKFRGLSKDGVIYANGLVANTSDINVDIKELKSLMEKD